MPLSANDIWRDFNTAGVPASGAHKPIKADIRAWGTAIEATSGLAVPGAATVPLFSNGVGVPPVYRAIVGIDLPNPSATTPGAIFALPGVPGQVLSGIGADGQPDLATVSGTGSVVMNTDPSFAGSIKFGTIPFATASGSGHILFGPDGRLGVQLLASNAFYKSNLHTWTDDNGGDQFATLSALKFELAPAPFSLTNHDTAFKITQQINDATTAVNCVDWWFSSTAFLPGSNAFRIVGGPTANVQLYTWTLDHNNPVFGMLGRSVLAAPPGSPTTIYAAATGFTFNNASGTAALASIGATGIWSFFGTSSGTHTVAAQAAASGASTLPNTNGLLWNTGLGPPLTSLSTAVNFNAVGDYPINITLPPGATAYRLGAIVTINTGPGAASLTTAQMGMWSGPGATGINIIASGTALTTIVSNSPNTQNATLQHTTVVGISAAYLNFPTLFYRVTQAQGAAAAGRVTVQIVPMF